MTYKLCIGVLAIQNSFPTMTKIQEKKKKNLLNQVEFA
jgi:hypothetical protein